MTAVLLLVLAAEASAPASAPEVEAQVSLHLRQAFERIGRTAPRLDPSLCAAARSLAADALVSTGPAAASAEPERVTEAMSRAGAWDAQPKVWIIRAAPLDEGLLAFERRTDLGIDPASHAGVAVVGDPDHGVIALVLADRKAELRPFPRKLKLPGLHELCGELWAPLGTPEVFVTLPNGRVQKEARVRATAGGFCAEIGFPTPGRYALEVLGTGPSGPEVAALFAVEVGDLPSSTPPAGTLAPGAAARASPPEPATLAEARALLLARINALRLADGAPALTVDARLEAVAQAYAERMALGHFFAHVAPEGDSLSERLRAAGYAFQANGENLGRAGTGPLAAHASVEESPGHRRNLLLPVFSKLGVGVAQETYGGRNQTLVVEVLAAPDARSVDPVGDAYRRIAEQRAALGLPVLSRSPQLEVLATEQARIALDAEDPHTERLLAPERLHARVSETLRGVESTSAELFVAEDLSQLPRTHGVADGRKNLVGVGAVPAGPGPGGGETYWVVVIYADRH
ncbi:MAG: CAP domain-containing protein [Myxococcaceae bacterium]